MTRPVELVRWKCGRGAGKRRCTATVATVELVDNVKVLRWTGHAVDDDGRPKDADGREGVAVDALATMSEWWISVQHPGRTKHVHTISGPAVVNAVRSQQRRIGGRLELELGDPPSPPVEGWPSSSPPPRWSP